MQNPVDIKTGGKIIFRTEAGLFEACIRIAKIASAKQTPTIILTTNNVINLLLLCAFHPALSITAFSEDFRWKVGFC